jgi:thiol-disulfide isomerase/thioredoxin
MRTQTLLIALCATGLLFTPFTTRAAAAAGRTIEQVQEDMKKVRDELNQAFGEPGGFANADKRAQIAPKAIPALQKMQTLLGELAAVVRDDPKIDPDEKKRAASEIADGELEYLTIASALGDAAAIAEIDKRAKADGPQALDAILARQLAAYWGNSKDEAAQNKAVDEVQKIGKANPTERVVADTLQKMIDIGPASKAVVARAEDVVLNDLTGNAAKQMAMNIRGLRKMREALGKPVEIAGASLDGGRFSTKQWKGKVVLVDFWSTWCPPCLRELPNVTKMYIEHHPKGLEIVGVSSDSDIAELKAFLDKNKDIPWPQLFDKEKNPKEEWSPVATEWGVTRIPTMFLIDRKGVLRSINAEENYEKEIPKLLEEKAE